MTKMNRREFNLFALASITTGLVGSANADGIKSHNESQKVFSAFDDENGKHFVAQLSLENNNQNPLNLASMQIPFRAHDTLALSPHRSLSFGRRPHNQMIVCDFETKQQLTIDEGENRHFYGHGCIDTKRNTLFTTENDYENARGVIGLRDSKDFKLIGEYESYGVGPHDVQLMSDKKTLVVANGGIETHPEFDYGRRKLNIKTMQPSLVFIDIDSGKKIDEYRLSNHQLSIRHLAITANGEVGVGTQYQGKLSREIPNYLVAWFDGKELSSLNESEVFSRNCKGYIADVAVDAKSQILAATSPRGNNCSFWNVQNKQLIKTVKLDSPSGICFNEAQQAFIVSNEKGAVYKVPVDTGEGLSDFVATKVKDFPVKWDNHLWINSV